MRTHNDVGSKRTRNGKKTTLELRFVIEEAVEKITNPLLVDDEKSKKPYWNRFRLCWRLPKNQHKRPKAKTVTMMLKDNAAHKSRHPENVRRVFNALRNDVNTELGHIQSVFRNKEISPLSQCLEVGGRLVMISAILVMGSTIPS